MEFLAKGHRGIVYTDKVNGKKICIKIEKRGLNRIENEARFLQILNKQGIGPKFISYSDGMLKCEFISGKPISEKFDRKIAKEVLRQCFIMDKLGIDKFEMHHPLKHVIIGRKIVMIDFERCKYSKKPKNVTGFSQFVSRKSKIKIPIKLMREYKKNYSEKSFEKILDYFKL